jgi:phosphonate transport system substrate-binding protein
MAGKRIPFVLALAGLFWLSALTAFSWAGEIRFAMSPRYSNNRVREMVLPLLDHLAKETGEKFSLVYTQSYDDHFARCRFGEIELSYSNALEYIKLAPHKGVRSRGFTPLVCAVLAYPESDQYWGQIIVRSDSGISDVSQLIGKRGMYVASSSLGGYLLQFAALKDKGIDAKTDLDMEESPSQKQDVAVAALYNGRVDFIFVRNEALKVMASSVDTSKLKVIFETAKVPQWVISVSPQVDPSVARKIKDALLGMDPANPEQAGILKACRVTRWKEVSDSDYDSIRALADKIGTSW